LASVTISCYNYYKFKSRNSQKNYFVFVFDFAFKLSILLINISMQKRFKIITSLIIAVTTMTLVGVFMISIAQAEDSTTKGADLWSDPVLNSKDFGAKKLENIGLGKTDPRERATNIIRIVLGLLGVIAVILIMYGGYIWMTSAGDQVKVDNAKNILRNAVIGLLIILSAFALATYILNRLIYSTGGVSNFNTEGTRGGIGLGALGDGIVKSVYPVPGAKDVARNTAIIVTFREEIDPKTICNTTSGGCDNSKILPNSVKIFKSKEGDGDNNVVDVYVSSKDNKTFIFNSAKPFGSQSEPMYYSVYLSTDIKKENGKNAFRFSGFQWSFEVSTILDLEPPHVVSIFPGYDNMQDKAGINIPAIQAKGAIEITSLPREAREVSVSYTKGNDSDAEINIPNISSNSFNGSVDIAISEVNNILVANIAYNMPGYVTPQQLNILDNSISLCNMRIEFETNYDAGDSWHLDLQTKQQADVILIANTKYSFVNDSPEDNEILINSNLSTLAQNIKTVIDNNSRIHANIDPSNSKKIIITAVSAGQAGNRIELASSSPVALVIYKMSGGSNKKTTTNVVGSVDKPRNSIIQINFNEAINPLTVVGPHDSVVDRIMVIDQETNKIISGEFVISNQYRTVEFIPSHQCGMNGCGEIIYCLPGNSSIRVDLIAAKLTSVCTSNDDCLAKLPFRTCNNGICYDIVDKRNHPNSDPLSGITDLANNSLDGNSDNNSYGPVSFYNANTQNSNQGDNYQWSFWVSNVLDLSPPKILSTNVAPKQAGVHVGKIIEAHLNKLMMSNTLSSGSVKIKQGSKTITHQLVNIRSLSNNPLGYWITKQDLENSDPPDNEADETIVQINHTAFNDSTQYRAQLGSGIKDIYQNCYKPSSSTSCIAGGQFASCCDEIPTIGDSCK
jgi:hypothetical protein